MADIYCIRHGQASFATDDYDQLSEIGYRQAHLLGQHLLKSGVVFDRIYVGSLKRQIQTAEAVVAVYRDKGVNIPELIVDPRWNELETEQQVTALAPHVLADLADDGVVKADENFEKIMQQAVTDKKVFQKLIRATFDLWIAQPELNTELESWSDASQRVTQALREVHKQSSSGNKTAIFSSGGIIAIIVAHVLSLPSSGVYPLFEKVINCSITRLINNAEAISLSSFNEYSYLNAIASHEEQAKVITYR